METWTKKNRSKKSFFPHRWELASAGVDFPGKSDSRSLGTEECVRTQKRIEAERLKKYTEERTSRECVPVKSVCTQIKYTHDTVTYTGIGHVFIIQCTFTVDVCKNLRTLCMQAYLVFIYKHTKSLPLSTMKCYDDIPKLPLKMQWNNVIDMRNGN